MIRLKHALSSLLLMLGAAKTVYVCPMHPDVISETPGLCPKCHMKLDPKPQVSDLLLVAATDPVRWM